MALAASATDPWQASWRSIHSLAWWLLERSNEIEPQIPPGGCKPFPLVRIWDDEVGCTLADPLSLTVFRPWSEVGGRDERLCLVREATWRRRADIDDVYTASRDSGKTQFREPRFSIRDAPVPEEPMHEYLSNLSACIIPAISIPDRETDVTDVGSMGFEYTSDDEPPTIIRYQWSCGLPHEWRPLINHVIELKEFLLNCLDEANGKP